jgi:23S rRNA (guanosine2251-2'-O)-methyltransferase
MDEEMAELEQTILEGHVSIEAALAAGNRPIHAIYVREDKRDGEARHLARLAQNAGVPISRIPAAEIDERAQGKSHGGLIAEVGPRCYVALGDLLPTDHPPFVVMIDGVEDPFNFGYALRALYAVGADGLVLRPRNWMSAAGTVARASAGASERIPTAVAETAEAAASFFRGQGLIIACTGQEKAVDLDAVDLTRPIFLLVGGEKRGITRSFLDQADLCLRIPYGREFGQSLGTAAAAAILGYEVMRQRRGRR